MSTILKLSEEIQLKYFEEGEIPDVWLMDGGFWIDIYRWDDNSVWQD